MGKANTTATVSSRVPREEKLMLYALAELENTTPSALLRGIMVEAVRARLGARVTGR